MSEGPPNGRNRNSSFDFDRFSELPIISYVDNSIVRDAYSRSLEIRRSKRGNFFVLKGERNDEDSVSLILRIADRNG